MGRGVEEAIPDEGEKVEPFFVGETLELEGAGGGEVAS